MITGTPEQVELHGLKNAEPTPSVSDDFSSRESNN